MTGKPFYKKVLFLLFSLTLFIGIFTPKKAYADTESKPSVTVTVKNFGTECYGTLLSKYENYGPWSTSNPLNVGNKEIDMEAEEVSNAIKEFIENNDDFYYLNNLYYMDSEKNNFSWTYMAPESFKILIYYPETGKLSISNSMSRYAFNSYYVIDGDLVMEDNLRRNGTYRGDGFEILARVFLTLIIELCIALLFKYSNEKCISYLCCLNCFTQLILNVVVGRVRYIRGPLGAIAVIIFGELIVFIVEMILDSICLPKLSCDTSKRAKKKAVWYGFIANLSSLAIGELIIFAFEKVILM